MPIKNLSVTAASNNAAAPFGAPEGMTIASVNDTMRQIMADVRTLAAADTIAAAATTDIGSKDATFLTLTGTAVTITALGTVSAGIYKIVIYNAAHTLTNNATSLILLGGASRTVAPGDVSLLISEGSGNWRELFYERAIGSSSLLIDYIVPASTNSITFSGLNLATHKGHRVEIDYIDGSASAHALYMYANSDTVNTNYYSQIIYADGTVLVATRSNNPEVAAAEPNNRTKVGIDIYGLDNFICATSNTIRSVSGAVKTANHSWSAVTTGNLTTLTFSSTVLLGIGANTRFRIYRKDQ